LSLPLAGAPRPLGVGGLAEPSRPKRCELSAGQPVSGSRLANLAAGLRFRRRLCSHVPFIVHTFEQALNRNGLSLRSGCKSITYVGAAA
jgi:hypothetical protein